MSTAATSCRSMADTIVFSCARYHNFFSSVESVQGADPVAFHRFHRVTAVQSLTATRCPTAHQQQPVSVAVTPPTTDQRDISSRSTKLQPVAVNPLNRGIEVSYF